VRVLDSDHWVALLRAELDLQSSVSPEERLGITAIGVAELTHGAYKSTRRQDNLARLDVLLAMLDILPFDEEAARQFGILKAQLESQGDSRADLDLQIASIAVVRGLTLVTHNQNHFQRIPGLKIEDWL
jgi:tRNA(fMet)-specific endonuclease VapC